MVKVTDGDTITILTADKQKHRICLAGIGAPEKKQAFGHHSKQNLSRLAYGKQARADELQGKVVRVAAKENPASFHQRGYWH